MSIERHESEAHKRADQAHERAQSTGAAVDYTYAAQLYERCGDYRAAAACREAAGKLAEVAR